ncbi:unnamed protein product [Rotaria sp. Silwood1]|nr:unnamed protein product [Rotaria sp. Silwood1]CAF1371853.1 unnamed protein product [Rotaria sp. Silwood1]CAF3582895.1 unnamed protein product [Rotaria sp. Silwood1]CAF4591039.1 unnamed protein product [Rotaria sp. Silwood1]
MLYMPTATLATPVIVQETLTVPIQTTTTTTRYYMLPTTTTIAPVIPLLNTALVYPTYGLITKPIEKIDTGKSQISDVTQSVQHVVHHHPSPSPTCSIKHCPGYCELCCPWIEQPPERHTRSRSPSPPTRDQERYSRRDEYDRSKHYLYKNETIDEKIERIRRELNLNSSSKHDKSTETIDYYRPTTPVTKKTTYVEQPISYKQHYNPPKSRSRSRSTSSHRGSSLPREPWRSTNQNDYPWRDAHLPAYRQATLNRSQTPDNEYHQWNETAHQRSHLNTQNQTSHCKDNYIYRPKSEIETRKYYIQTTGKNPDCEVHQALHHNTTSCCDKQKTNTEHSFYSDIPTTTLKQMNLSSYNNVCRSDDSCLHIVPKHGSSTLDPPYLKILNAPVTYLH